MTAEIVIATLSRCFYSLTARYPRTVRLTNILSFCSTRQSSPWIGGQASVCDAPCMEVAQINFDASLGINRTRS